MTKTLAVHPSVPLVVDLDGTLIRTDMLLETFWSACSCNLWILLRLCVSAFRGMAAVKQDLALASAVDIPSLPYNNDVIAYIRRWKKQSGKAVLVTGSNQAIAQKIADHLGLFDEVHGSDGTHNLIGANKARFLVRRFGAGQYAYIGDSKADIPSWNQAAHIITVNASPSVRKHLRGKQAQSEHITTRAPSILDFVKALRVHQWLKNILVFVPMVAAHMFTLDIAAISLVAFSAFSLIASSVYILNDLVDLDADRHHPRKRYRPLASGSLSIAKGSWIALVCLLLGFFLALQVGTPFTLVMLGYYGATILYSFYWKRWMIIDICLLAALYATRIIAGGVATDIALSPWLLTFSIFFFLSLGALKRQTELADYAAKGKTTASGRAYHVKDLPIITSLSLSSGHVAVLVLALYIHSPQVQILYTNPNLLWGLCLVLLFWISRAVLISYRGDMHDDPTIFALQDNVSQLCLVLVIALLLVGSIG